MSEQLIPPQASEHGKIPESLFSGEDLEELQKVLNYFQLIDDAFESGSGGGVSDLVLSMKVACDPILIRLVETERQRARQALRTALPPSIYPASS